MSTRFRPSRWRTRSYKHHFFGKVALLTIVMLVLLLSALSLVTYLRVEQLVVTREYEASLRVLRTTGATIGEMDSLSRRVAVSIYMNPDVQHLMTDDEDSDLYDVLTRLTRLDSLRIYNPMIDSIIIYNGSKDITYDTQKLIYAGRNPFAEAENGTHLPRLTPVYRRTVHPLTDGYSDMWTEQFAYANYALEGRTVTHGMIVSVDTEWLISSVKRIGDADNDYNLYLLDGTGELLYGSAAAAEQALAAFNGETPEHSGYAVGHIDGVRRLVIYSSLGEPDWTVIMTRPFADLLSHINGIRRSIAVLTGVFGVIAAVAAVLIARVIYRPISNLVSMLGPVEASGPWDDEFDFISHRLKAIQEGTGVQHHDSTPYRLFRLLNDSPSFAAEETQAAGLTIDLSAPIVIAVAKVDDVARELPEAIHAAVTIDLERVTRQDSERAYIHVASNRYVIIANARTEMSADLLVEELVAVQRALWNEHGIPLSISTSETVGDLRRLTAEYNATTSRLRYTYIYGSRALITAARVLPAERVQLADIRRTDLERRLVQAIHQGAAAEAQQALGQIAGEYRAMAIDTLQVALAMLVSRIREAFREINERRLEPSSIDFDELSDLPRSSASLKAFTERLSDIIGEFVAAGTSEANSRHSVIVAHLLEAIQNDYTDPNLALKTIASDLGMSAAYVGHMFKDRVGESFADYLKNYRLERATAYLERNVDASVREVMQHVGFDNESYFYRIFKTRYGVTPREYVLKIAMVATKHEPDHMEVGRIAADEQVQ